MPVGGKRIAVPRLNLSRVVAQQQQQQPTKPVGVGKIGRVSDTHSKKAGMDRAASKKLATRSPFAEGGGLGKTTAIVPREGAKVQRGFSRHQHVKATVASRGPAAPAPSTEALEVTEIDEGAKPSSSAATAPPARPILAWGAPPLGLSLAPGMRDRMAFSSPQPPRWPSRATSSRPLSIGVGTSPPPPAASRLSMGVPVRPMPGLAPSASLKALPTVASFATPVMPATSYPMRPPFGVGMHPPPGRRASGEYGPGGRGMCVSASTTQLMRR